jgi:type I restriction enzyme R subunit
MPSQTNEAALEDTIERDLNAAGFTSGSPGDFNRDVALDEVRFWHFLETTQPRELDKLRRQSDWKRIVLTRYDRVVKKYGILRLLRTGLKVNDAQLTLLYQPPLASSSQTVGDNFASNEWSLTRQLRYHRDRPGQEIDVVVFVNGIPLVTMELKNAWTGQTARRHGQKQYREDRDPKEPLLQFGRCLVHFAVDTDEVYMTTKLAGGNTRFLPFNKGTEENGAGNPVNPNGHKTDYLWREVLTPLSLANIIQHFVRFDGKPGAPLASKALFFPRYHQLDVVRKILAHATEHGAGQTYLVQHSAGSGKSNSITWAAYQLIEICPPGEVGPLFDSVIVVTDRRLLDKQIRDNIQQFSQVNRLVAWAKKSADLREAMEQGKRIIITTIQKFPFIIEEIGDMSDKRFAVIIDEAHSSQGGATAAKMNEAMGGVNDVATPYGSSFAPPPLGAGGPGDTDNTDTYDGQDLILQALHGRKMRDNASYLAFTATPKNATLERFGDRRPDGSFRPFHLYSMKQAIEEGFILDVLTNYTTYRSYYEIEKSVRDNPEYDTLVAQKRLKAFVERDPRTIATKAEIMVDHFLTQVVQPKKLRGKAKGMIVTQSITSAIRYYRAIRRLLEERGDPFRVLVAFSGTKEVDGIEYTEAALNGFAESETRDKFDEDDCRLLVVANKYLTGFDQPKLTAMYVDKKLQGVLAVQALSRLNRANTKLGKRPEDLFVLDFFNTTDEIKTAFDPFYTTTSLSGPTDVSVLHDLLDELGMFGVYVWEEVVGFSLAYFRGVPGEELSPLIDRCALRFNDTLELEDEQKADFKIKAKQFVKVYGQMASIIDFQVEQWETLYWFLKFLIPKLRIVKPEDGLYDDILDSVDLSSYGLERRKLDQHIALDEEEAAVDPLNPNIRGAHAGDGERSELDLIVQSFNERYFSGLGGTPEENRVKLVSYAKAFKAHPDLEDKVLNNTDKMNAELAFDKIYAEIMAQRRRQDLAFYKLMAKDEGASLAFRNVMKRMVRAAV